MKKIDTADLAMAVLDFEADISILRCFHPNGALHMRIENPEAVLLALKELAQQRLDYGNKLTGGIPKYPEKPNKRNIASYRKKLNAWCKAAGLK